MVAHDGHSRTVPADLPASSSAPVGRGAHSREADEPWPAQLSAARTDPATPLPAAEPFRSVGFTVSTTGYAIARLFREILAPLALEPREFALLRAVGACEGQSQQAIGERLGIPASRMVAFIDALEQRGLLE
ncbi:MAG: MarR family winged helix-turn-helix transcriptional regulator, partial [Actinomycetota bacterium]|nr:MarR family winged helix-turn-helix transcriptional regulator [Actinomycetota bacterium]